MNDYGYTKSPTSHYTRYKARWTSGGSWVTSNQTNVEWCQSVRLKPKEGGRSGPFRLPTPWGMVATQTEYNSFEYKSQTGSYKYTFEGTGSDPSHGMPNPHKFSATNSLVVVSVDANVVARARVEALNKIKDQNINVGTALGESKTTLLMLASSVSKLVKAIRAVRRGRWSEAGRVLGYRGWRDSKGYAQSWLEYQYGWMPLINDIYGAQEQLKKGFREKDQIFKVSRQITNKLDARDFVAPASLNLYSCSGVAAEICKVVYWQKVSNPSLLALNNLGLVNPLSIAWELVPFSFVVDWLLPIGNFLDGLTSTLGTSFVAGYEDRIVHADVQWEHSRYTFVEGTRCKTRFRQYAFQRVTHNTWALPVPYWKNPFTSTHVVSALALLRSLSR